MGGGGGERERERELERGKTMERILIFTDTVDPTMP